MTDLVATNIEVSVEVNAPVQTVWDAIVQELEQWWPNTVRMFAEQGSFDFTPKAGGHLIERHGEAEVLWGTVVLVNPGKMLTIASHLAPPQCGPATSLFSFVLTAKGEEKTTLKLTDDAFGVMPDQVYSAMDEGWQTIVAALKQHCEG